MQTLKFVFVLFGLTGTAMLAEAQGGFQNLSFEGANIPPSTPIGSSVSTTAALPGWNAYNIFNTQTGQVAVVTYDGISFGGAIISVIDTSAGFGFNPIQGTYSALLFSGGPNMSSISQSKLVPTGTESLEADISWSGVAPIVAVNGQVISMVPLAVFSSYTMYGGDISSFAGLPATLAFTEPAPASMPPSWAEIDAIQFSTQPIPEPGAFGLFGLGAVVVGWRFRRGRQ
jgi:hypothetical protein